MRKESDIMIFGHGSGKPSFKNLKVYNESRWLQVADNGLRKGCIAVMRLIAMDLKHRKLFQQKCRELIGRNIYSQYKREYVFKKYKDGKYYSDCSSIGMAILTEIGYHPSLLNTEGIYKSPLFKEIKVKIKNGHITNPWRLKVGDCILYIGNDSNRTKQIGHVEYVYSVKKAS